MADIKDLGIFRSNKGLDKIRAGNSARKSSKKPQTTSPSNDIGTTKSQEDTINNKEVIHESPTPSSEDIGQTVIQTKKKNSLSKKVKGVGAPIRKFDRSFSAQMPLKLSPILNATSRVMVEKYETNLTRDEILRKALDEYIKQHLTQEDKQDLFNNVMREVEMFREKKPTIPETDVDGNIIRTVSEIEEETQMILRTNWGMNYKH
ncbi:hypothetical protein DVY91_13320 [Enterococcus faecalis]|uniref:Uncharacterized protein n=1 Tax=Enterococcus casseliflavus TaxID=37734 RepID=A0AAW8UQD3_ENTCA|nr:MULTISPECIES: hypothetical protein [Enterococcus]AUC57004.1 hypothetical protein CG806_00905 [Enterococcus faecalis ARO1/DG]AYY11308.1 hypothetical protein EGX73_15780 [Enterococcus sp. FDAARGOS_553]MBE9880960.1 hypothetical protein [Enterococcus casseliflavus]MBO6359865.1 hypothetical protein [Enterococcus casseliflavus]MBO6377741.1 hypothetical protein [Enterococcus casseliflavus]